MRSSREFPGNICNYGLLLVEENIQKSLAG
jgi:hypothetical protein